METIRCPAAHHELVGDSLTPASTLESAASSREQLLQRIEELASSLAQQVVINTVQQEANLQLQSKLNEAAALNQRLNALLRQSDQRGAILEGLYGSIPAQTQAPSESNQGVNGSPSCLHSHLAAEEHTPCITHQLESVSNSDIDAAASPTSSSLGIASAQPAAAARLPVAAARVIDQPHEDQLQESPPFLPAQVRESTAQQLVPTAVSILDSAAANSSGIVFIDQAHAHLLKQPHPYMSATIVQPVAAVASVSAPHLFSTISPPSHCTLDNQAQPPSEPSFINPNGTAAPTAISIAEISTGALSAPICTSAQLATASVPVAQSPLSEIAACKPALAAALSASTLRAYSSTSTSNPYPQLVKASPSGVALPLIRPNEGPSVSSAATSSMPSTVMPLVSRLTYAEPEDCHTHSAGVEYERGSNITSQDVAKTLADCLVICIRQCNGSLPDKDTVLQLWKLANRFSKYDLSPHHSSEDEENGTQEVDHTDWQSCQRLVTLVLSLLQMLQPVLDASDPASLSNSSSSKPVGGKEKAHSQSAAATRAARVLMERRIAQRGLFQYELLFLLASGLQILDNLFSFFEDYNYNANGTNARPVRSANLAHTLYENGKVVQSLHSVSSFLLRCLRKRNPREATQPSAAMETLDKVQEIACSCLCRAVLSMFQAISALQDPEIKRVMQSMPDRFFETLGCVACEGLPCNNDNACSLARLLKGAYIEHTQSNDTVSMEHCPAWQVLVRRSLRYVILQQLDLEDILFNVISYHPQLEQDTLLSQQIVCSLSGPAPLPPIKNMLSFQGTGGSDETSDAYFLPCVRDDSLQRVVSLLPLWSRVFHSKSGVPLCASAASVLMTRMTAVLLSLQNPYAVYERRGDSSTADVVKLVDVLFDVARYASALATRLLHGLQTRHSSCECYLSGEQGQRNNATGKRSAVKMACKPCSFLAEGLTAVLLQILRLRKEVLKCCSSGSRGRVISEWQKHPGVCVALEAGMRHMGSSEKQTSPLRHAALALIMDTSTHLTTSWIQMYNTIKDPSAFPVSYNINLYMSLLKCLRLEVLEGKQAVDAHNSDISSVIPAQQILDVLRMSVSASKSQSPHRFRAVDEWEGSQGSHDASSSSSSNRERREAISHSKSFQAWLRPQLIMLRSWVLFWVELSDRSISPSAFSDSTATKIQMVASFQQASGICDDDLQTELVLEACGVGHVAKRTQAGSIPGSHARWERFANLHLDGIPLPGCSNWACTNLSGFSEGAMFTQLCSGCKRVRYCSTQCQMAAWVGGEHREVCTASSRRV